MVQRLCGITGIFHVLGQGNFGFGSYFFHDPTTGRISDGQLNDYFGPSVIESGFIKLEQLNFRKVYRSARENPSGNMLDYTFKFDRDKHLFLGEWKLDKRAGIAGCVVQELGDIEKTLIGTSREGIPVTVPSSLEIIRALVDLRNK